MNNDSELKALCEEYAADLPNKLAAVRSSWDLYLETHDFDSYKELIRKVHSLIGSGATFGFSELSKNAAIFESALRKHENLAHQVTFEPREFEQLFNTLNEASKQAPETEFNLGTPQNQLTTANVVKRDIPVVLLVSNNGDLATILNSKLTLYGIQSYTITAATELLSCIREKKPDYLLLDIASIQNKANEIDIIKPVLQSLYQPPAIIVISEYDDMPTRLSAVRAGAIAYFITPVDTSELVSLIRKQCTLEKEQPYRILIVDDDDQFAHHIALLLNRAEMKTHIVTNPMTVLDALAEFQPEIILLDLHMPECSGLELAAIIRQQCLYTGVAIVFFSTETDIDRHIEALRVGGNDFFIKGLPPKQLVAKVEMKAKYARQVQKLMLNDALTGLSNRTLYAEIINKQIAYCQRYNSCFSYVILDLDYFKQINDQYGHQSGDDVLRSLASIITNRLRSVDTAIRYGGEEIVILLSDSNATQAKELVNELLQLFSQVVFTSNNSEFSVTFSAGIADYPSYTDISMLAEAADQALYKAKTEGRNQVRLAEKVSLDE